MGAQGGRRAAVLACVLAFMLAPVATGCGTIRDFFGDPAVFESAVEPVDLDLDPPVYAAMVPRGLAVRSGESELVVPWATGAWLLPGGRALVTDGRRYQAVDVAGGELGASLRTLPGVSVGPTAIHLLRQRWLLTYDLDLRLVDRLRLPGTDEADLVRGHFGTVATVGSTSWVQWGDYNPDGEDVPEGGRGLLRIVDGETTEVAARGIVDLWPSADGAALLALRQVDGEDCGGCIVPQEVVELDPATGEVVRDYGMPPGYDESWRVLALDKVNDRVAVRFYEPKRVGGRPVQAGAGTWSYDGSWELVEDNDTVTTWWQAGDRLESREDDGLVWVSGEEETPMPGDLVVAAGQLLPPA